MSGDSEGQGSLVFAVHGVAKSWTQLNNWTTTRVEDRITRKWGKQRLFAHEQSDSPGNSPLPRCHEPSPAAGKGQCPLRDSAWILYRWMKRGLLILRHLHGHLIPRVPLSLLPLHYHIKIFEGRYCVGTLWCRTLDVWWDSAATGKCLWSGLGCVQHVPIAFLKSESAEARGGREKNLTD